MLNAIFVTLYLYYFFATLFACIIGTTGLEPTGKNIFLVLTVAFWGPVYGAYWCVKKTGLLLWGSP